MNPLSALPSVSQPGLRPQTIAAPLGAPGSPAPIPFSELEKLSPGILPLPIDPGRSVQAPSQSVIGALVNDVSSKSAAAGEALSGLLSGQNVSLHQTVIAMEEASVSFQLMVEVRNKLLESYQELMRMQI
jgi:flagellar hook-basal body complex protein FliE